MDLVIDSVRECVVCLYVHLDLVILFMRKKRVANFKNQQTHRLARNMFARDKYQYIILIFHSFRIKEHKWPDALINAQYVVNIYVY